MKRGKKGLILVALMLVFAMVLTACGPSRSTSKSTSANAAKSSGSKAKKAPKKPAQLTLWVNDDATQAAAIKTITDNYTKKTGIKVVLTRVNMTDQAKKLAVAGPQGKGPDLFFQPHDRIGDLVTQGLAAPIDPYITNSDKSGYSPTAIKAVSFKYQEGSLGDTTAKTHLYGFPAVVETYALFYNKDMVKSVPKTFDDLKKQAKAMTNASQKKYGVLFEGANFYYTYPFLKNFGGYIFGGESGNYNASDLGVANAGAVKGMKYLQSFYTEGLLPKSVNTDIVNGLFTQKKAAMVISGPWSIPSYKQALGDKLATAPLPTMNGKPTTSFSGVKSWMLSYYSKNKYWAADLAKYMTNDASSKIYFDKAGEMVPRPSVLDNLTDPIYKGFTEQIKYAEPMPNISAMAQVWTPMGNAQTFIAQGKDVQKALTDAKKQIQQQIKASK